MRSPISREIYRKGKLTSSKRLRSSGSVPDMSRALLQNVVPFEGPYNKTPPNKYVGYPKWDHNLRTDHMSRKCRGRAHAGEAPVAREPSVQAWIGLSHPSPGLQAPFFFALLFFLSHVLGVREVAESRRHVFVVIHIALEVDDAQRLVLLLAGIRRRPSASTSSGWASAVLRG